MGEQQPQQAPRKKTYQQPKISPSPVRWSKFERSFEVAVGRVLITLCLMIVAYFLRKLVLIISNGAYRIPAKLSQITKAKSSNTSLQQEIAELTTPIAFEISST